MGEPIKRVEDLKVYQMSMDLGVLAYQIADGLPDCDRFGLVSQIRKSALSIPSNIAEGFSRGSRADYARFLGYALTSCRELETQLKFAVRLGRITREMAATPLDLCDQIQRMLNTLIRRLSS